MTQIASVGMSGGMPIIEDDDPIPGLEVESVYIPGPRGFHFGGLFKGYWDMSSGTSGPASPIYDFNTTHTITTITPDANITSVSPLKLAIAASEQIQIPVSGAASASITVPTDGVDDSIYAVVLYLANYDATPQQLESLMNGNPSSGLYTLYVAIAPWGGIVALGAYNDGVSPSESGASVSAGDVVTLTIDYATGEASIAVNGGSPVGPVTLDLAGITSAQGLQLVAGVISNSEYVTFADGHVTVDFSGFASYVNATLPVGAEDGDWYKVSAGGHFHGTTTRAGQFVKLISGKTGLIVIGDPNTVNVSYKGTWASILTNYPAASYSGCFVIATDRYGGAVYRSNGTCWNRVGGGPIVDGTSTNIMANYDAATYAGCRAWATDIKQMLICDSDKWRLQTKGTLFLGYDNAELFRFMPGCSGDTYSQNDTTVTVTTANGQPGTFYNGAKVYLKQSTGGLTSGWFTNYQYVDATHYTVTSSVSQTTSGNLGSNTVETFLDWTFNVPSIVIDRGNWFSSQIVRVGKANANSKTTKMYIDGHLDISSTISAVGVPALMTTTSMIVVSNTQYQTNNIAGGPYTIGSNVTYSASNTFANGTDWAVYWPRGISANIFR